MTEQEIRGLKVGDVLSDARESQHWHRDVRCVVTDIGVGMDGIKSNNATGIVVGAVFPEQKGNYPKYLAYTEAYLINSLNVDHNDNNGYIR